MAQTLLNPRAAFRRKENPIAGRLASLNNKVLGLIDNSKTNADVFLDQVEILLKQHFDLADVIRIRKSVAGTPAPYSKEFFTRCDAAVNAFGD